MKRTTRIFHPMLSMKPFHLFDSPLRGSNLIEASAGTGKTTVITWLFLRLLLEERLSVNEILAVTFTEAATEELRDRVRSLLREAVEVLSSTSPPDHSPLRDYLQRMDSGDTLPLLTQALRSFDEAAIFTIHGFCARTLRENAFESGSLFDTELATSQEEMLEEVVEDFWRRNFYHAAPELAAYALDKKVGPEYFKSFLGNLTECPDLHVPEIKFQPYSCQPFRDALRKVREAWPGAREAVENIFHTANLSRKKYRLADLPTLLQKMAALVAAQGNPPALFPEFEKFTSECLSVSMNKKETPPEHPFFYLCQELSGGASTLLEAMDRHLLYLKYALLAYVKGELEIRKRRQNARSFSDLLTHLRAPLTDPARGPLLARSIRKKYKAALIDEFQDTDPVQWDIFRTIFQAEGRFLFLIGDPKQAIYGFRGADVHAYMEASEKVHARYTLGTNYRSEAGLVEAVNALFSKAPLPFVFDKIHYRRVEAAPESGKNSLTIQGKAEPPFHFWFTERSGESDSAKPLGKGQAQERLARAVATEAARLINLGQQGRARFGERPLAAGDIAVLTRTHREAQRIQQALSLVRVPSVLESTGNLFDSHEATEMQRILAAIMEPQKLGAVKAALATDILGLRGEDMERLVAEEVQWSETLLRFRDYHQLWSRHDFIRMFRHFMAREGVRGRLLDFSNGERRVTNVLHISEALHQKAAEKGLGMDGTCAWLAEQRKPDSPVREKEHELRLESDDNAVRIVTIHKSKGLEYPVVFCPFLWGGSDVRKGDEEKGFVYHDAGGRLALALGLEETKMHKGAAEMELLAENLRLFYVALTRAKNRCYLAWGGINNAETSAPAYLFHNDAPPENFLSEGASRIRKMSDEELLWDLASLVEAARGNIILSPMPREWETLREVHGDEVRPPVLRSFTGKVEETWRISSFSSLVFNKPVLADLPDRDPLYAPGKKDGTGGEDGKNIFSFPRGTKAGTFLHEIFENLDFATKDPSPIVEEKLKKHGYESHEWLGIVTSTVRKVLDTPLEPGNGEFTLSKISVEDRIHELEFHFPIPSVTPRELGNIFAKRGGAPWEGDFPERVGRLNFSPAKGFMKGFMDMVFQFGGRYYLLDWKSNHLGNRVEDYSPGALSGAMEEEFYILQYHIYAVALHRYLSMRVKDYNYSAHFGGVYYIFLRGVDPDRGSEYGIFKDFPSADLLEGLNRVLGG